jgi:hypothetical protein
MYKVPEVWFAIPGTIKYQISNYGNVRRMCKNGNIRQIKSYMIKNRGVATKVEYKNKYQLVYVHKIMAEIFLEPGNEGEVIWHKNGLITDNYAGNLEWITRKELGRRTGGKSSRSVPVLQIDPNTNEVVNFYKSIAAAARDNYIHKATICLAIKGKLKTAAGYKWKKDKSI